MEREIKEKEEFLKLSEIEKVKYCVEQSLKDHKGYNSQFWKGSAHMAKSVLELIEDIKDKSSSTPIT